MHLTEFWQFVKGGCRYDELAGKPSRSRSPQLDSHGLSWLGASPLVLNHLQLALRLSQLPRSKHIRLPVRANQGREPRRSLETSIGWPAVGGFSAVKRKFGDSVRSKTRVAMKNEAYAKLVADPRGA